MIYYRKLAAWTVLCLFFQLVFSQDVTTSSRILIESGGSVPFSINSMKKYQEGMAYEDWSRLALAFSDSITIADVTEVTSATWKLEFKANTHKMFGDYGGELDLSLITLQVACAGGNNDLEAFIIEGEHTLNEGFTTLIEGAPQGSFQDNKILITYRIGQGAEILKGNPPDYFTVDIIFELSKWAD